MRLPDGNVLEFEAYWVSTHRLVHCHDDIVSLRTLRYRLLKLGLCKGNEYLELNVFC